MRALIVLASLIVGAIMQGAAWQYDMPMVWAIEEVAALIGWGSFALGIFLGIHWLTKKGA